MTEMTPASLRRRTMGLAAVLTVTVLTAVAAVGGLTRWSRQPSPGQNLPAASVIQAPAPAHSVEVDD